MRLLAAAFELADAFVDQGQQVSDPVGHRRIGCQRGLFRSPADQRRVGAALEHPLGFRDQIAEYIDLFCNGGTAAEQDFGEFLEPEQPERQVQRVCVDSHRLGWKGGGEFIVRIENEHPQGRIGLQRLVQQQRDRSGLAHARRSNDREVARQQGGDMNQRTQRGILRQIADDCGFADTWIIDHRQIGGAHAMHHRPEIGILRDAGAEFGFSADAGMDLADQFDFDMHHVVGGFRPCG